ncbi:MAG: protein-disulfide reductase DsbD domain-containing protein, partial [Bacteroidales bacterium]
MVRKLTITVTYLFLFPLLMLQGQVLEPVTWSFGTEKTGDNKFDIVMTAEIDNGWHLYAMDIAEGGPIATSFTFEEPSGYALEGKPVAIDKPEVKFDNSFGMDIGMHSVRAGFRQKITVTQYPATVKGFVTFMSCDDKQCLPPRDIEFSLVIKGNGAAPASAEKTNADESVVTTAQQSTGNT